MDLYAENMSDSNGDQDDTNSIKVKTNLIIYFSSKEIFPCSIQKQYELLHRITNKIGIFLINAIETKDSANIVDVKIERRHLNQWIKMV